MDIDPDYNPDEEVPDLDDPEETIFNRKSPRSSPSSSSSSSSAIVLRFPSAITIFLPGDEDNGVEDEDGIVDEKNDDEEEDEDVNGAEEV